MHSVSRRSALAGMAAGLGMLSNSRQSSFGMIRPGASSVNRDLRISDVRITPIALPDPPLLAAGGCHGPYFLRNIIEIETDEGVPGIGETHGGESVTKALEEAKAKIIGRSAFAYRSFASAVKDISNSAYAGIELACLDAIGHATTRRLCELLGGPVREQVEFASYLFFRYAADHPLVLSDPRLVDQRGKGERAVDQWGEVRSPESMGELAWQFHKKFGFRVHKLKAGVFEPAMELEALEAINDRFQGKQLLRIDPNGRWTLPTALSIGRKLRDMPLEYYEDPVAGQAAMADVRAQTGLVTSTNSCVTRFHHIPPAVRTKPIDVVLGDHHGWGGITAFQTLGTVAKMLGWGLSQHSNNHAGVTMAAMIHAGAITPELTYASDTHYVWLPEGTDVIEGPNLTINGGRMEVPTGPGLGVRIDQDKLAEAHEVYVRSGMRSRNDANTMQKFVPGWERNLF